MRTETETAQEKNKQKKETISIGFVRIILHENGFPTRNWEKRKFKLKKKKEKKNSEAGQKGLTKGMFLSARRL